MPHPIPGNVPLPVDGVEIIVLADTRDVVLGIVVVGVGLLLHLAVCGLLRHGPGVGYVQQVVITRLAGVGIPENIKNETNFQFYTITGNLSVPIPTQQLAIALREEGQKLKHKNIRKTKSFHF